MDTPLIVITNDDGYDSPGLLAAAQAVLPLGEVLVAAPCQQWSGAGRSMPAQVDGRITRQELRLDGREVPAFCVNNAPAGVVRHALLELAPRRPALFVVGINYGENLGVDITISGTVGAALEAAAQGIPALAVSLEVDKAFHLQPSETVDFTAAAHFTRLFARALLAGPLPFDVDVLKVDVPREATPDTPWRLTRVSRAIYFVGSAPKRADLDTPVRLGYEALSNFEQVERDSDIYAMAADRVVSVSPISTDLTSRVDRTDLAQQLRAAWE